MGFGDDGAKNSSIIGTDTVMARPRNFSLPFPRSYFARLEERLAGIFRDTAGGTLITFALVGGMLTVTAGGGIDVYRQQQQRAVLQSVADAAVMAGAIRADNGDSDATVQNTVKTYITTNFDTRYSVTSTVTTQINSGLGQVSTQVTSAIPTTFLKMLGIGTLKLETKAAASYGGSLMEVALAMDVTGSMYGTKLADAKSAAKSLLSILFTVPGTNQVNTKVKVGLVPFARYVNVGTGTRGQSWLSVPNDTSVTTNQCWQEDVGGYCAATKTVNSTCSNDGATYPCSWEECTSWVSGTQTTVCGPVTNTSTWYGCVGSRNYPADLQVEANAANPVPGLMDVWCNATLTRLSQDQTALNAAIDGLSASDETYIAPGMLWAWRVVSHKQPFADGNPDTTKTKKAIILMTDGYNTVSASYPAHWNTDTADSNSVLAKTCANAKADGITVFTVAFQVTDPTIKSILTSCATSASYFFDSSNSTQLTEAFKKIGSQLSARRLVY